MSFLPSNIDHAMQRGRMDDAKQKADLGQAACRFNGGDAAWNFGAAIPMDALEESVPAPSLRLDLPEPSLPVEGSSFEQSANGRYLLTDLLEYCDRDFIHAAYLAILRRTADQSGLSSYLGHLRDGMSKLEILGILRNSDEGRKASVVVVGLRWRYGLLKAARLPIIGGLVRVVSALLDAGDSEREQRRFEGWARAAHEESQSRQQRSFAVVNRALVEFERGFAQLISYAAAQSSRTHLKTLNTALGHLADELAACRALIDEKAGKSELRGQIVMARSQFRLALDELRESMVERATLEVRLEEMRQLLGRALESKADQDAVSALERLLDSVAQATADRAEINAMVAPIYESLAALSSAKAEQTTVEAAVQSVRQRLEAMAVAKADRSELATVQGESAARIEVALAPVHAALAALSSSKAEQASIEGAVHGVRQGLEAMAAAKADRSELAAVQADGQSRINAAAAALRTALVPLETRAADLRRNLLDQERRVGLLLEEARKRLPAPFSDDQLKTIAAEEDHYLDAFYATFEDRFRGTRAEIKRAQSV